MKNEDTKQLVKEIKEFEIKESIPYQEYYEMVNKALTLIKKWQKLLNKK